MKYFIYVKNPNLSHGFICLGQKQFLSKFNKKSDKESWNNKRNYIRMRGGRRKRRRRKKERKPKRRRVEDEEKYYEEN